MSSYTTLWLQAWGILKRIYQNSYLWINIRTHALEFIIQFDDERCETMAEFLNEITNVIKLNSLIWIQSGFSYWMIIWCWFQCWKLFTQLFSVLNIIFASKSYPFLAGTGRSLPATAASQQGSQPWGFCTSTALLWQAKVLLPVLWQLWLTAGPDMEGLSSTS